VASRWPTPGEQVLQVRLEQRHGEAESGSNIASARALGGSGGQLVRRGEVGCLDGDGGGKQQIPTVTRVVEIVAEV
jgi:hypothetical protein